MNVEVQGFTFRSIESITIEAGYISLWADDGSCFATYSIEEFSFTGTSGSMEITHK